MIGQRRVKGEAIELGGKLAGLSLVRQVIALASWPLLQNVLGFIVGFADMMIAGRMEEGVAREAILDTMGLSMYIGWLLVIIQGAVATGAQALVARSFGARDFRLADKASGQAIVLGAVTGVFAGFSLWLLIPSLIQFFELNDLAAGYAKEYMQVLVWSAPFSGILFVASSCMRGSGDTKMPFVAMGVLNVVNVALSCLFVFGSEPIGGMGVAGLAWGTVLGWAIGAGLMVWVLMQKQAGEEVLRVRLEDLKWDGATSRRIFRIGVPQLVEVIGMWSIHAFGVRMIGWLAQQGDHTGLLGAHGLAIRLESLSFMPGFALGSAASTLAGQYLGAGSVELAKKSVRICWVAGMATMGTAGVLLILFAEPLVNWMAPGGGPQAELAVPIVRMCGFVQPFFATAMVMKMALRGAGATGLVMIYSFGIMLLIRVGVLAWAVYGYQISLQQVWMLMIGDLVIQACVFTLLFYRSRWYEAEV